MKTILLVAVGGALLAAAQPQTFTGRITDTMCGARHGMIKDQPDDACVRVCVKTSSSQYALFDGKALIRFTDQKLPAKFAGQTVRVTGTYNEKAKTIKPTSIEAVN